MLTIWLYVTEDSTVRTNTYVLRLLKNSYTKIRILLVIGKMNKIKIKILTLTSFCWNQICSEEMPPRLLIGLIKQDWTITLWSLTILAQKPGNLRIVNLHSRLHKTSQNSPKGPIALPNVSFRFHSFQFSWKLYQ